MRRIGIALALALTCFGAAAQAPSPVGIWTTFGDEGAKPEGRVRIEEVDGEFVATVIAVLSADDPNPACTRCEGELRGKPIVGLKILKGLRREGDAFGGGTILDPDEGRSYRCAARLLDGGRRLELRGYIGLPLLGRTQVWLRADTP
jgi:uncharacterized protein (DUF2147 family)